MFAVLSLALLAPMHTLVLIGMEHSMHIAVCLVFLGLAARTVSNRSPMGRSILAVAAIMVWVRYEGLFVVAGACLLLLFQKRWRDSALLTTAAWFPVIAFGVYSKYHGGHWLPNPLLLKGGPALYKLFDFCREGLHMAPLMFAVTWLAAKRWKPPYSPAAAALGISTVALWLHFALGRYGWVYRYEAYLIALSIVSVGYLYAEARPKSRHEVSVAVALAFLTVHAVVATITLPGRSRVIYTQQFQTAKLAALLHVPIAVNDIGAVAYFNDLPVVDLVGLGTQEIMNERIEDSYTTERIGAILRRRGVRVLAIYDNWFKPPPRIPWGGPPMPPEYVRLATLHTHDPYAYAGEPKVSYYALPQELPRLRAALESVRRELPPGDALTFTH
jgi:hypothetical protein